MGNVRRLWLELPLGGGTTTSSCSNSIIQTHGAHVGGGSVGLRAHGGRWQAKIKWRVRIGVLILRGAAQHIVLVVGGLLGDADVGYVPHELLKEVEPLLGHDALPHVRWR